ncbi:hypothetical protein AB0D27_16365, partial [Streptomyces sp. NPDC048415]|uniref:hypothetical protein n=1 Tax=Streptomyces sp. NPDC048415 TaxID=3154822 RepID=UPI003421F793
MTNRASPEDVPPAGDTGADPAGRPGRREPGTSGPAAVHEAPLRAGRAAGVRKASPRRAARVRN